MISSRKKPGMAFWATVVVVVVPMYPVSFGPVRWLVARDKLPRRATTPVNLFFRPLNWFHENAPEPVARSLEWYARLWDAEDKTIRGP